MRCAQILSPTSENIRLTAQAIQNNQVIGMPTETVYGLAGNAHSEIALQRIFHIKNRPFFDPLIVHVGRHCQHLTELENLQLIERSALSKHTQQQLTVLINQFWPGPLTLVLPKHPKILDLVTSGLPQVALRMPQHPVAQALIAAAETPLAAPSANRFGRISPTTSQAVFDELGDRIQWILEGGSSQWGLESTILSVDWTGSCEWILLRPGGISQETLEAVLGQSIHCISRDPSSLVKTRSLSPGLSHSHYAPQHPLRLLPHPISELQTADYASLHEILKLRHIPQNAEIGLLLMSGDPVQMAALFSEKIGFPVRAKTLSVTGDLLEIAHSLFQQLRTLDQSSLVMIFSEPCRIRDELGAAITDRLLRASASPEM